MRWIGIHFNTERSLNGLVNTSKGLLKDFKRPLKTFEGCKRPFKLFHKPSKIIERLHKDFNRLSKTFERLWKALKGFKGYLKSFEGFKRTLRVCQRDLFKGPVRFDKAQDIIRHDWNQEGPLRSHDGCTLDQFFWQRDRAKSHLENCLKTCFEALYLGKVRAKCKGFMGPYKA